MLNGWITRLKKLKTYNTRCGLNTKSSADTPHLWSCPYCWTHEIAAFNSWISRSFSKKFFTSNHRDESWLLWASRVMMSRAATEYRSLSASVAWLVAGETPHLSRRNSKYRRSNEPLHSKSTKKDNLLLFHPTNIITRNRPNRSKPWMTSTWQDHLKQQLGALMTTRKENGWQLETWLKLREFQKN